MSEFAAIVNKRNAVGETALHLAARAGAADAARTLLDAMDNATAGLASSAGATAASLWEVPRPPSPRGAVGV
jgi:ankyrin repeat protein